MTDHDRPEVKKYEVINPSDKCYVYSDDWLMAAFAVSIASKGYYGLKDVKTEAEILPVLIFDGFESFFEEHGIQDIERYALDNHIAIADILDTLEYDQERTSFMDIGQTFHRYAEMFRTVEVSQ